MPTEMGEYLVGAYLKIVRRCDVVDYNIRPPGGGLIGLGELDVIGFDFVGRNAYLCEVTTHLDGLHTACNCATFPTMKTKKLTEVLKRVEAWPPHVQNELAEFALELDAGFKDGEYEPTAAELAGIDRGLRAAAEGRFATDQQVEAVFAKFRGR